ncbi:hypothetical protein C9I98_24695 [Photobacterium sanctipauli]|uniref:Uncharacterized protein n=1 Tax=Photobacterium sanctipauli TaxID=1342794 RepID=A0A2T3NB40_9GAMM|nr:hypothetical protein C9I98_24695 [Photobacterium sanctipauli]
MKKTSALRLRFLINGGAAGLALQWDSTRTASAATKVRSTFRARRMQKNLSLSTEVSNKWRSGRAGAPAGLIRLQGEHISQMQKSLVLRQGF